MLKSILFAIVGVIGLAMPVAAEDVRAAIEETNAQIVEAFKGGDAATIAGNYTEDGKMLPPDATEVAGAMPFRSFGKAGWTTVSRTELLEAERCRGGR